MDLWTIIKIVVRRWYISVPLIALTGALGYQVISSTPPLYQTTATVLFVVPSQAAAGSNGVTVGGSPVKQNPYLAFNGSLNITANAVAHVVSDVAHRKAFTERGLRSDYKLTPATELPGIILDVSGPDATKVTETGKAAVLEMKDLLGSLQDESAVAADQRIEMKVLDPPSPAIELQPKVARVAAAIGAVGLAFTIGMTLLVEGLSKARRSARRNVGGSAAGAAEPGGKSRAVAGRVRGGDRIPATTPRDEAAVGADPRHKRGRKRADTTPSTPSREAQQPGEADAGAPLLPWTRS